MMKLNYIVIIWFVLGIFSKSDCEEIFFKKGKVFIRGKYFPIKDFFLDEMEVSNLDYKKFLELSKFKAPAYMHVEGYKDEKQALVGIDWYEANLYCRYNGKRLPSYVELIYASQGGTLQDFPFGNEFPAFLRAPFITQAYRPKYPLQVQEFKEFASLKGVLNLAGNVAEWTSDWISKSKKSKKIVYGGSYTSSIEEIKIGSFVGVSPNESTLRNVGFRCARTHSDIIQISSLKNMAPEDLKALAFKDNISDEDFIKIKKKSIVKQVKKREKKRDLAKQKLYLKKLLFLELQRREDLVSQAKTADVSSMIAMPFGMFMFSANDRDLKNRENLTYLDAFDIDRNLVSIQDVLNNMKNMDLELKLPFSNIELNDPSLPARLFFGEALSYCKALDKSLPSEAQWEKSVRGLRASDDYDPKSSLIGSFGIDLASEKSSEWMFDYLGVYKKEEDFYKNPMNLEGIFRYLKGPFDLKDYQKNMSRKITAMPWSRANFRCVSKSERKANFEIDLVNNYYFPDHSIRLKKQIEAGQNIFQLNPTSSEFEKRIEELDQELE
ncbi:formylglycine-generating enzyme family protein [bacterium]|nr:formylglycine-generating enzyme family protein [bacterium]